MKRNLVNRIISPQQVKKMLAYANELHTIVIDDVAESDILQIGIGAFSPLVGFLNEEDYLSVLERMRLISGEIWPMPVVLPITGALAASIYIGNDVALICQDGFVAAILSVESMYNTDLKREAEMVYKTQETEHPGVLRLFNRGSVCLGGSLQVFPDERTDEFSKYFFTPQYTKQIFANLGWKTVVGFQTRNPIHRAHEYIQKTVLETVDGLF